MRRIPSFFLLLFSAQMIIAQNAKLDSLSNLISTTASDTARLKLILNKVYLLSNINLDSSINLALRTLNENKRIGYYRGEVDLRIRLVYNYSYKGNQKAAKEQLDYLRSYVKATKDSSDFGLVFSSYGIFYGMQSKYDSSIYFYEKAIGIYEKTGIKRQLGSSYSNIAIGFQQQSNFPMALFYYQKSLKVSEELNDELQQAYTNLNIANINVVTGDSVRAEKTFLKAITFAKKLKSKTVELYAYTNLSSMYIEGKQWQKAYDIASKAATLAHSTGDQGIEAASLSKAASALAMLNQPAKALAVSERAIEVADSSAQPFNIWQAYGSKGFVLMMQKRWKDAIPFYEKAMSSLKDADAYFFDYGVMQRELSECYEKAGAYTKALASYKKYATIADSVKRKDNVQKTTELTMNYEFDKKEQAARAEQKAKDAVTHAQQLALIIGLVLSLIIIAGAITGYRNKRKANILLHKQKLEIETQKDYLTAGINYARRIQKAVFPTGKTLSDNFPEHFILFKPLDVVSGDFYWYKQHGNEIFIAAADCTGHGVPGAFMSILGITYLNELINETKSCNPNEILDQLRENVIKALHQSDGKSNVKDGMEVALCRFNLERRILQFSGAFRPMFLLRDNNIQHIAGDNIPIAVYDDVDVPFTNHEIQLMKNDIVYIFTDGYVDQIGGPERKTFKTKRLKELLLEISGLAMCEQRSLLDGKIKEWQGELDQIDDILVVGIKILD
jgi:serine phosphatase RsbU (regulator of sigma subunit)/lipopolysaccharide biosynthesis regulator YciM